jgi:hypothetical protein
MEDIKNMDFELITNVNLGVAEIIEGKFNRVVTVIDEYSNLKKITTRVFWNDRAGKPKNVETNMLISRTQLNPRDAAYIILYADSYTVLPDSGTTNIIAVIKDIKGNTKINWTGGNIRFSIIPDPDGGGGYLPGDAYAPGVTPTNGTAHTTFTGSAEGDVVIEASVDLPNSGGTISETITIRVTLDVVRVELIATPLSIKADGTSISTITAALVNSIGGTVVTASNEITFNISGEGIFVDYFDGSPLPNTLTLTPSNGIVNIKVKSIVDAPGVAIVTATSEGLLSDTVNIMTTGQPNYISILAHPDIIYTDDIEGATVIVTINDINGNPVNYIGTIGLSTNDTGTFGQDPDDPGCDPDSLCFNDVSAKYTTFSSISPGIVTITASGEGLISGNTDIEVRAALVANNIALTAEPQNIPVGGGISEASTIKAIIRKDLTTVSTYSNEIIFEIISDTSSSQDASLSFSGNIYITLMGNDYGNDGEATVQFLSSSNVGIATIKVSTTNSESTLIEETVQVASYSDAHHILLSAYPPKMEVLGGVPDNCIVTATIVDVSGTKVQNYNEEITFTFLEGHLSSAKFLSVGTISITVTANEGVAYVDLVSQNVAGTAKIRADSSGIYGDLNIPVGINLELAATPNITYDDGTYEVSFDIIVQGADLFLEEMQVSWDSPSGETLNKIEIKTPSTVETADIVFDGLPNLASSGELINIEDITLLEGTSNVKFYFNASMSGKTLEVIFNPNSGNYPVEIIVPTI